MPRVNKNILIGFAGVLWSGVGVMLNIFASRWFHLLSENEFISAVIGGIFLGTAISYFGFSNLAVKNIERINLYKGKVCIWAFQKWQSYLLIIFMIALGVFMRKTSFVPKFLLTPMYIAIGFALFTASFKYYIFLFNLRSKQTKK